MKTKIARIEKSQKTKLTPNKTKINQNEKNKTKRRTKQELDRKQIRITKFFKNRGVFELGAQEETLGPDHLETPPYLSNLHSKSSE